MLQLPQVSFGKKIIILLFILIPLLLGVVRYFAIHNSPTSKAQNFEIAQSYPEDQSTDISLVTQPIFVFSKKITIAESDLKNYFEITPKVNGSWHLEKNKQVVYFSADKKQANTLPNTLQPQTVYTVTVKNGLNSEDGKRLTKEHKVQFRTSRSPEFIFGFNKRQLSVFRGSKVVLPYQWSYGDPENSFRIGVFRELKSTITVQKASKDELLQYFSYKKDKSSLFIAPDSLKKKEKTKLEGQFQEGTYDQGSITINNPIFEKPGIYYLTITNKFGSDGMFVVVSDHVAQLVKDDNASYVWVTKGKESTSYPGVTISSYSVADNVKRLNGGVTDSSGIYKSNKGANDIDFVIAQKGDDVSVTYASAYGKSAVREKITSFGYLDKPVYKPGDALHYKAIIRSNKDEGYVIQNKTLYIKYRTSYLDQKETYKKVATDDYGTVTFDTTLPSSLSNLYPSISLNEKREDGQYYELSNTPVIVESYRKPDMEISVTSQENEYISGDTAHFTIKGATMFGQPLSNIEFSYRILLNTHEEIVDRTKENIDRTISYYGGGEVLTSGGGRFDANGKAEISFQAALPASLESSQTAIIEVTPKIGAAPSIGKMIRLVHRGTFALFIDPLKGDAVGGISGTVTAMDHQSPRRIVGDKKGKVSFYIYPNYSGDQVLLGDQEVAIDSSGKANFTYQPKGEGRYLVKVSMPDDRGNTVTGSKEIYVGSNQYSRPAEQFTFNLTAAKNEYNVGETARVTAKANFSIQDMLIVKTINNGFDTKIIDVAVKKVNADNNSLELPINDDSYRTVGYDVMTVHDGKVLSSRTDVKRKAENTELNVNLKFDRDQYRPGDSVTAMLKVTDKKGNGVVSDNSLSVIDASLLQIETPQSGLDATFHAGEFYLYLSAYNSTTGIDAYGPGGGGGCFLTGTEILMMGGTTKNIEDVRVGDMVLTRDSEASNALVPVKVTATFRHSVNDYLIINDRLNITPVHKVYLNGVWQTISNAKIGDVLVDEFGNKVTIFSISESKGNFTVYNLTTEDKHTFFANGIYVHNEKGGDDRKNFVDSVYWNPHITTDTNGDGKVTFKMPDNLTTFSAQVFTNTKDSRFGETTAKVISKKEFNIIPSLPNFYFEGDKPEVTVLLQNSSDKAMPVTLAVKIKEVNVNSSQNVALAGNDFVSSAFDVDLTNAKGEVTFQFEAKDENGKVLDAVLLKRPILQRGNVNATWNSYVGSREISYTPDYPKLDFNMVKVSVVPNLISGLFGHSYVGIDDGVSAETGKSLYAYSYILARTRDGFISPTDYQYAYLRNRYREVVRGLQAKRDQDAWRYPKYLSGSYDGANLWLAAGFEQGKNVGMLDELTNVDTIVASTKKRFGKIPKTFPTVPQQSPYVTPYPTGIPQGGTDYFATDDMFVYGLVMGERVNATKDNQVIATAIDVLNNRQNVGKLIDQALPTSKDRLIWDVKERDEMTIAALATVEKGSLSDMEKAIRGLSILQEGNSDAIMLYIAARYAERKGIYVAAPEYEVLVNGDKVEEMTTKDWQKSYSNNGFTQTLDAKSSPNGKVAVSIKAQGDVPVYTTVTSFNYSSKKQDIGDAVSVSFNLKRGVKDANTKSDVTDLAKGSSGIITLNSKIKANDDVKSSSPFYFMAVEPLRPDYIYLNQESYNSPQYHSVLDELYPGKETYWKAYNTPHTYSDEVVIYEGTPQSTVSQVTASTINMPYIVYRSAGGSYYQPKTSLVFTNLGIIVREE